MLYAEPTTDPMPASVPRLALGYGATGVVAAAAIVALPSTLALPLAWLAVSMTALALAFATGSASMLGKRADGQLSAGAVLLFLPYYLFVWGFFHFKCLVLRRDEPAFHEVRPGLFVGRRPLVGELPPGILLNVDLTSEFRELPSVADACQYMSLPTLNRSIPDMARFGDCIEAAKRLDGPIYVHCGAGRGRATMFMATLLVAKGLCTSVEEAIDEIASLRPGVHVHPIQLNAMDACVRQAG